MGKHMQIIDIRNEKSFLFFVDQPLPNADFFYPCYIGGQSNSR